MVFIRLKSQRSDTDSNSKKKKKKKKHEKGTLDDDEAAGSCSYQPHIVDHSISIFLKNLRKLTAFSFQLLIEDVSKAAAVHDNID